MGKKELIKNGHFERGTIKNLKQYYNYVYKCDCKRYYGSDKKENKPFSCPICIENERTN